MKLLFKQQLMQALQRGLAQGPENAIDVCRLDAPAIAAAASIDGLEIGRSSHRLRNPANAPTDWQRRAIDHYLGSQDRDPMVIDLGDNRVGYAEPITTAPSHFASPRGGGSGGVGAARAWRRHSPRPSDTARS